METIHEILMNAAEEDLSVLINYYDAVLEGINYNAKLAALNTQDKVTAIVSIIKKYAKDFFIVTMDYNEIVLHVAQSMDIDLQGSDTTDCIELKIACRFITDNFQHIPKQEKLELLKLLKQDENAADLKYKLEQTILSHTAAPDTVYAVTSWLAKATSQAFFLNKGAVWQTTSTINRLIQKILGNDIFRKSMILPLIYIAMLRCQYRSLKAK